jgi:hypothetical protein
MKRAIPLTWALGAAALCGVFCIVRASENTTMVGNNESQTELSQRQRPRSSKRPLITRNAKICSDQCEKRAVPGYNWR